MRQKTEFSACPPPYKIERIGEHSAKVSFAENAVEIKTETGSRWEADVYELVTAYTTNIEERIESNYDAWIASCNEAETEEIVREVMKTKNALLAECDYTMAIDRINLSIPTITANTATQACNALKTLCGSLQAACSGEWAEYRQALREIDKQPGFPRDIVWPKKPEIK